MPAQGVEALRGDVKRERAGGWQGTALIDRALDQHLDQRALFEGLELWRKRLLPSEVGEESQALAYSFGLGCEPTQGQQVALHSGAD